ncbi:YcaO-like family protein [Desulfonatronum parangueonense]
MTIDQCLAYLEAHPNDVFMRQHMLQQIGTWEPQKINKALRESADARSPLESVFIEAVMLSERLRPLREDLSREHIERCAGDTPLIHPRAMILPDHELHKSWIALFRANMLQHEPLPPPNEAGLAFPVQAPLSGPATPPDINEIRNRILAAGPSPGQERPTPEETARIGLEKLERLGVIHGPMQRHEASLSPIALLRQWQMEVEVRNGRLDYSLSGIQTSYGRGLVLEHARAALVMEMVERKSSFASFSSERVEGCRREHRLAQGSYSRLRRAEMEVLDPNSLSLEVPYRDEPLTWISGERIGVNGPEPMLVPAQCVFLFCNLDEVQLFSGLGSTGLASGNTMEEAKVSALLEVIERDHEGVTPYDPRRCFTVETRDPSLAGLLRAYVEQGVYVRFQDLTSELGVPCCKCFVVDRENRIVKGCGAGLDAKRALLSALTETPFAFPSGPPSRLPSDLTPDKLMRVPVESLPNYSTGSAAGDLALLEAVLAAHGFQPIYVDLTRADIDLPVVRAIVPGMEISAEFEWHNRVHPRLFRNYLRMMQPESRNGSAE